MVDGCPLVASIGFARFEFNLVLDSLCKSEPKHIYIYMGKARSFVRRPSKEGGSLPLCVFRHREHSLFSAFLPPNKQRNAYQPCAGLLEQRNDLFLPCPLHIPLPWLVKVATQLCTSKEECNKLDLNAAQYFSLIGRS